MTSQAIKLLIPLVFATFLLALEFIHQMWGLNLYLPPVIIVAILALTVLQGLFVGIACTVISIVYLSSLYFLGQNTHTSMANDGLLLLTWTLTLATTIAAITLLKTQYENDAKDRLSLDEFEKSQANKIMDLYQNAPCGYHSLSREGVYIEINNTELELLGYDRNEMIGRKHFTDLLTPESRLIFFDSFSHFKKWGWIRDLEIEMLRKDGSILPILLNATAVFDSSDHYLMSRSTITDMSYKKKLENDLARLNKDLEKKVQDRTRELASINDELQLEVERRTALQKEAEHANRIKDEFFKAVSHDLRTPLTIILGYCDLLFSQSETESIKPALEAIHRSATTQAKIVDELLDISRITSGKFRFNMASTEPVEILQSAITTVAPSAEAKRIQIISTFDETVGPVFGDSDRLHQLFWNLLSNAIKFTQSGGTIKISAERERSEFVVKFGDNGLGSGPRFQDHIYHAFHRKEWGPSSRSDGLGLGIAIARHIIEAHGGEISLGQDGRGKGMVLSIRLPQLAVRLPTGEKSSSVTEHTEYAATGSRKDFDLQGVHVLVVDDEQDIRILIDTIMRHAKAEVSLASSAQEALDIFKQKKADIMLADIGMPGQDGYQLIREIHRIQRNLSYKMPAIALTAYASEEDRSKAIAAGYQLHLTKPIDAKQLTSLIGRMVKGEAIDQSNFTGAV